MCVCVCVCVCVCGLFFHVGPVHSLTFLPSSSLIVCPLCPSHSRTEQTVGVCFAVRNRRIVFLSLKSLGPLFGLHAFGAGGKQISVFPSHATSPADRAPQALDAYVCVCVCAWQTVLLNHTPTTELPNN